VREAKENGCWEIVTDHLAPVPWPFISLRYRQVNYDRLIKVFSPTFVSRRAFAACEYLLGQGAEVCRRAGAQLVVMTIPDPLQLTREGLETLYAHGADARSFDLDLADRAIGAMCEKLRVPFVVGKSHLTARDYKKHDGHWNVRGNRKVSDILRGLRHQYGAGELQPRAARADKPVCAG
jgi:hypothetical protein